MASHSLGTRLKAERESRGFTLVQIAESTKIPLTLLQALERNDLSRWPKGLYRRAFFRSYVTALGLRPDPLVLEFARLFPDDVDSIAVQDELPSGDLESAEADQPLALASAGPSQAHRRLHPAAVSLLEMAGVATVGEVLALTSGLRPFEAIGAVALVYLPAIRVMGGHNRRVNLVPRRKSATRRVVEAAAPLPVPSHLERADQTPTDLRDTGLERLRPLSAGFAKATSAAWPVAQRTGQILKVGAGVTGRASMRGIRATSALVMRGSRAAGVRFRTAARATQRVSSRGLAAASHAFWKGVRSAAEHAELLASRQLNRTND